MIMTCKAFPNLGGANQLAMSDKSGQWSWTTEKQINKTNLAVGKESNLYPPNGKTIAVTFCTRIYIFQTDRWYFSVYYILNWDVKFN